MKPFAESSEQNKEPILAVLREQFDAPGLVLEIGSGTGQHAVFFPRELAHLTWQPSDVAAAVLGIEAWRTDAKLANVLPAMALDVKQSSWPNLQVDYVFSANTAHIMSWPEVEQMFAGIGEVLNPGGRFCLYGPFNYQGRYTSDSNQRFDNWLKARDPLSGIRDFELLNELASAAGLVLVRDYEMPVNNRTLVWSRK